MADVLSFVVPTFPGGGTRYPSVNGMWATGLRYGAKTPEYVDLFRAVRLAAWDEIRSSEWKTATDRVEVHLRRYVTTRRQTDASNQGKCELDAMAAWKHGEDIPGFPGLYDNDFRVRPFLDVVYDPSPDATDRICIAVFRLFTGAEKAVVKPRLPKPPDVPHVVQTRPSAASGSVPTLNGKPITMQEALAYVGREEKKR